VDSFPARKILADELDRSEHLNDDEDEDPLFSLKSDLATRGLARAQAPKERRLSASQQGKSKAEAILGNMKRSGGKSDIPDRHDIMRRAMAEATSNDSFGSANGMADIRTVENGVNAQHIVKSESTSAIKKLAEPSASSYSKSEAGRPASADDADPKGTQDKPGEGSLTIDLFADNDGEGDTVLPDGQIASTGKNEAVAPATPAKSATTATKTPRKFPVRPKLGSRNNSYQSDTESVSAVRDSPTEIVSGQASALQAASASPVKERTPGHQKYATTGHAVEPVRSKQTSLAVPGSNGSLDARQDSLIPNPLNRLRKLSDAATNKRNSAALGGIAGALAASGMAGMGVGHAELLQRTQAKLSESPASSRKNSRSRASSIAAEEYVSGYEGGMYRDPNTGKMVERGPGDQDRQPHSRTVTNMSNVSYDGSDVSVASGLNAAANFALALDDDMLAPENPLDRAEGGTSAPLTPGGIGAVGGLSPSGLGERVTLEDDGWHDMGAQITGFAVASSKRNNDFHAQFPAVPEDDYLIEDYGCALVREILIQGRLFISENHVCFYANIFGWVTNIVMPFSEIMSVEKRMTAYVIPNAIQIATLHAKSTFASFLSRDTTYDLIVNIWKLSHPALRPAPDAYEQVSEDESLDGADGSTVVHADVDDKAAKSDGHGATKKSKRKLLKKKLGIKDGGAGAIMLDPHSAGPEAVAAAIARSKSPALSGAGAAAVKRQPHRKTTCNCGNEKDTKHFANVVLDTTYPAVPEKLYNLIFTSGFMKEFWQNNQKLLDLHMSDWAPNKQNSNMLSRDLSYIKPLTGSFGPKQTKCMLTDENIHVDFDQFITTMTTTRTPDVPSGGSFSIKTKTCITWDGGNVSRIVVSCMVEWSGRSMLKSVIDRASIDGQKQYYVDLDKAIRAYIKNHASEFREEGEDDEDTVAHVDEKSGSTGNAVTSATSPSDNSTSAAGDTSVEGAGGASAREQKTLTDRLMDVVQPLVDIVTGSLGELSPTVLILGAVVFLLVVSNLWALTSSTARDPLDPHRLRSRTKPQHAISSSSRSKQAYDSSASAEAVAHAVRDALRDFFEPDSHEKSRLFDQARILSTTDVDLKETARELDNLTGLLDQIETRIATLRQHIRQAHADVSTTKEEL
jgi:hypothetical protein